MSNNWQIKKLGALCTFVRGPFGGSLKKNIFKKEGYAVYEQQHAINNQFVDIRYFIDKKKFNEMRRFELKPGDLIMSCSGTMGKIAIAPEKIDVGIINQALLKLTPNENLDVNFLKYWMESPNFQNSIKEYSKGAAIKNIVSVKILKQIEIPLPPLPEQKRNVKILDEAFEKLEIAKKNTEKNLVNAKELYKSFQQGVFNSGQHRWERKNLSEISENLDNKRIPITKRNRKSGNYPYYGASGIVDYVNDYIFDEDLLLISEDGANLLARTYPIAFSVTGKIWVNNHAHVLKFDDKKIQLFVEYYLNYLNLENFISGMAQPKLNQRKLNSIPIYLPLEREVQKILTQFSSLQADIKNLEAIYQDKLNSYNELQKSLLQKAFAGEL
jgi:type I restriction enzyme S subunit